MKSRSIVLGLAIMLLVVLTPGEADAVLREPTWVRRSPAFLDAVAAAPHAGLVTTGTIPWGREEVALWVARYSNRGHELWHRRWHPARGTSSRTYVVEETSAAFAPGGRVVIAGSVSAEAPRPGWFVRVYGPRGDVRWSRTEPGWRRLRDDDVATGIAVTKDMIVVAANEGPGYSGGPSSSDAYLLEFSLRGRMIRRIDIEPSRPAWNDTVEGVTVGSSGKIFVTGSADLGSWTVGEGGMVERPNADPYVMALTPTGAVRWKAMLRDGGTAHMESGLSIDLSAGIIGVVADIRNLNRMVRAYRVVRFSTTGARLWSRAIPTRKWAASWAEVTVAPTGAISLVADHSGKPLLRTFRANGTVAWSARVGSGMPPSAYDRHDVDATSAGVFVVGTLRSDDELVGGRVYRYRS